MIAVVVACVVHVLLDGDDAVHRGVVAERGELVDKVFQGRVIVWWRVAI